jgi:hypothetical protein
LDAIDETRSAIEQLAVALRKAFRLGERIAIGAQVHDRNPAAVTRQGVSGRELERFFTAQSETTATPQENEFSRVERLGELAEPLESAFEAVLRFLGHEMHNGDALAAKLGAQPFGEVRLVHRGA